MSGTIRNVGLGLFIVGNLLTVPVQAVLTTNSCVSTSSFPWDSGVIGAWSAGAPAIGNAACIISNSGPPKTVSIVDATSAASLTISNLIVSSALGPNVNTLSLATTNTFTVLQNITIGPGGAMTLSNATVDVKGLAGGFVIGNGNITMSRGATFLATNALSGLDIGHGGTGSLTMNGGRMEIIGQEVGTFAGDKGTLTIAGGTNVVTTDGLFIGDSVNCTGVVWITGSNGALIETNTSIYVGNLGSGAIAISNGTLLAAQPIIGNTAGGKGTLTVAGGSVELPNTGLLFPLIIGQSAGGTGTVWVTGGSFISTNGTPRIGDSGAGTMVVSNGVVLFRRAVLGYGAGNGTLTVAGGSVRLTGTGNDFSIGDAALSRGTFTLSGGQLAMTNDPGNTVFIGNSGIGAWTQSGGTANVVKVFLANGGGGGTLTVSGGLLTGDGTLSVGEGSGGTGTVWMTGGSLSITGADSFVASPSDAVGSMTISNGDANLRSLTVGVFGKGSLTVRGGTLNASSGFTLAANSTATANLTQSGGWLVASNGTSVGGGIVNIQSTGGTWLAGGLSFGFGNPGTFTINGGTNIFASALTVGSSSGSGSVWVVSGKLIATNGTTTIASSAFGQFTATGGVVQLRDVSLASGSPVGLFTVAGGSVTLATTFSAGFGGSGTLTVSSGSLTVNGDSVLGGFGGTGTLKLSGGTMTAQTLTLGIFGGIGKLVLTGGVLSVTNLIGVSGPSSSISFSAGTLNSSATTVTNAAQFVVGNAVTPAHFHLLGGTHAMANGLRIRNAATLSGCGTVSATTLVDTGGTVVADCGGYLTFTGSVTNNGLMQATGGSTLEFYGTVVNNGVIDTIFGNTNFHGAFINNGILLDAGSDYDGDGQSNLAEAQAGTNPTNSTSFLNITAIAVEGNDIRVTWMTAAGHTNALERTAGAAGSYSNDFSVVTNIITIGTTTNSLDAGAATNFPAFYYRVRLVP